MKNQLIEFIRCSQERVQHYRNNGYWTDQPSLKLLHVGGASFPKSLARQISDSGYYQSPEENSKVFDHEKYYYSGDLVQRNSDGNLGVVGRIKDPINRGGEKIASEEIVKLTLLHSKVIQVALVAIVDELIAKKNCAFIVPNDSKFNAIALRRHLIALGIAQYKLPDQIKLIESLPLTAVGKANKKQLCIILNTSITS